MRKFFIDLFAPIIIKLAEPYIAERLPKIIKVLADQDSNTITKATASNIVSNRNTVAKALADKALWKLIS